jgi:hypothetical protein
VRGGLQRVVEGVGERAQPVGDEWEELGAAEQAVRVVVQVLAAHRAQHQQRARHVVARVGLLGLEGVCGCGGASAEGAVGGAE